MSAEPDETGRAEPAVDACAPQPGPCRTVVAGVGARSGATAGEVRRAVEEALARAGVAPARITLLATLDRRAADPALRAAAERFGVPLVGYPAARLAAVVVPNPSAWVRGAAGTPSVAEAAALLGAAGAADTAAGGAVPGGRAPAARDGGAPDRDARLLLPKTAPPSGRGGARCTVALAAPRPAGSADGGPGLRRRGDAERRTADPADAAADPAGGGPAPSDGPDLRHHGDAEVRGGGSADPAVLTDLAVNVRAGTPPAWLRDRLAATLGTLAAYPDPSPARAAVARRHRRPAAEVLLTAGAAEAFVLLARALRPRRPVVVHPQFTEPEAALRDAGHRVGRVLLGAADGFRLDPALVPEDADLVVVGNPTNPTSVLHPASGVASLARPGRVLVVDEAFADTVPGEAESLAARRDVPGLVVLRSLTKTWGLAGLRVGYLLADSATVAALARCQPLWPVSSPALAAAVACSEPAALAEAEAAARETARHRRHLTGRLAELPGVAVAGSPAASFVLVRLAGAAAVRERMRARGFALRRGDTFPGLGPDWLRIAVRAPEVTDRLVDALARALPGAGGSAGPEGAR